MDAGGWITFVHPLFEAQLAKLSKRVSGLALNDPSAYASHPAAKLLATIHHYIRDVIPRNPDASEFRQGNTLGRDNRHWFRANFHARCRLFYRFSSKHKVIVFAWINDEETLRKPGSGTDPYAMFQSRLESGDPPRTFAELLQKSRKLEKKS